MMLDGEVSGAPREEDWGLNKVQNWKYKLCWRPNTCFLTGKQLWGKKAYHGVRMITGPGDPVYEDYWIDRNKFMLWKLTK
jgi:hypothetical protein